QSKSSGGGALTPYKKKA
ncbi:unnamed protein product, partial [Rotaria sordida]